MWLLLPFGLDFVSERENEETAIKVQKKVVSLE